MLKRILIILVCLSVILMFLACSRQDSPSGVDESSIDLPREESPADENKGGQAEQEEGTAEEGQEAEEPAEDDQDREEAAQGPLDLTGRSILTGLEYDGEYKPILVMVENSPAARPQSGLINADVVYETYVEGKLTRFFAVFGTRESDVIGPVRSTRKYFLDLVKEWDTVLVHYGASSFARQVYEKDKSIRRIDGMTRSKPFWRDKSRKAPHNAYVDSVSCRKEVNFQPKARGFQFTASGYQGTDYKKITIPYDNKYTVTSYEFDEATRTHKRFINGQPHVDRETGKQITATNIIIQYAKHSSMGVKSGNIFIDFVSSGKAEYFIDGKHMVGSWEKKSPEAKTMFYDQNGQEILLMPGNTWIQVVPVDFKIKIE